MSSKSRKNTNRKSAPSKSDSHQDAQLAASGESKHVAGLDIPDEVLHVPESETSPLRYILMILLVIVLLVIFVVPTAFTGLGQPSSDLPPYFSWERPGVGVESFDERAVALEAQGMQNALQLDIFAGAALGINAQNMSTEVMARLLVLDRIALDAGIQVPDIDLGTHLIGIPEQLAQFGMWAQGQEGIDRLREYLASYPSTEPNVRRLLRIRRLIDMSAFAAGQPSPEAIIEQWENEHTELLLDYVALSSSDFEEAARAELPSDEELEAWLGEQAQYERDQLSSPERRRIELVSYREGADNSQLLEKYPVEEGTDLEELAKDYHAAYGARRFLDPDTGVVLPFEDEAVKAACLVEAPVNYAMGQWLNEIKPTAEDGNDPGLLLASNPLGLSYLKTESVTREELAEKPEFKDPSFTSSAFFTPEGAFAFSVTVGPKGPVIFRVAEVTERVLPPFAEIRDQVADLWVRDRTPILGRETLDELRAGFDVFIPEGDEDLPVPSDEEARRSTSAENFQAVVEEQGYTIRRRDWLDIGGSVSADPMSEDEDHKFLNISNNLKRLQEGEVVVEFDAIKKRLFLVRCAGRRPVDVSLMSPKDFKRYQDRVRQSMAAELSQGWDQEFLFENFNFRFSEESRVLNPDDENFGKEEEL